MVSLNLKPLLTTEDFVFKGMSADHSAGSSLEVVPADMRACGLIEETVGSSIC